MVILSTRTKASYPRVYSAGITDEELSAWVSVATAIPTLLKYHRGYQFET